MKEVLQHDGIRFYYELIGEGAPLVFCHGVTGDLEACKELVGPQPGYQLIVWDSRGHGRTEPVGPAEKFTFAAFAEDLAALLDHLGIERAVIGGISMGAGVAAQFALRWPRRVRALVLVRPAWLDQPLPENLAMLPRVAELLEQSGSEAGLAELKKLPEFHALQRQSPPAADSLCEQFGKPNALQRRARLRKIPNDRPITSWKPIERLDLPALVVGSERDWIHPLAMAVAWTKHLMHGRMVKIPPKTENLEEHVRAFRSHLVPYLESLDG